jgi:hypothetical protein
MPVETMPTLRCLNAQFIHNYVTNDVAKHDALIHPRFVYISSSGARVNRGDYLAAWATGFDPDVIPYWDYRDERISVFGDVALVCSTNRFIIRRNGCETTGMSTYTDTYLREGGTWRCIQAQITLLQPEHYPGDDTIVRRYIGGIPVEPLQPAGLPGLRAS